MVFPKRTPDDDEFLRRLRQSRREPNPDTVALLEQIQAATSYRPPTPWRTTYTDAATIRSVFPTATDDDIVELGRFLTDLVASIRPPTEYEGANHVAMQILAGQLDAAVARTGRWSTSDKQPLFALVDTGHVTARTVLAPHTGDYLVLVDEELLRFLHLFSCAVVLACPAKPPPLTTADIRAHLQGNTEVLMCFVELILSYVMTGRVSQVRSQRLPVAYEAFASRLNDAATTFVLAHEYVHALEGHLSDGARDDVTGVSGGQVSQSLWSAAQEGIADLYGLVLANLVLADKGHEASLTLTYWGIELFLYANEILLKAISLIRSGNEHGMRDDEARQHAMLDMRRTALEFVVRDQLKDPSEERWAALATKLHFVRDIVREIWVDTVPLLTISHARGIRPSSIWGG
jgi:hypothetical protein